MKKPFFFNFFIVLLILPLFAHAENKTNYRSAFVFMYSPANSVYEDDNIKLEIYKEKLWATNKTEKTIFFDLSQCFIVHNGTSYPMFNSAHADEKNASKKNLTTSIGEFFSIAPSTGGRQNETFICNLAGPMYGKYDSTESFKSDFSEYEERLFNLINEMVLESLEADPKGKNYVGTTHRHLTEDESINTVGVNLAYAFSKDPHEWNNIAISSWVSDVCFTPYYIEMPDKVKNKDRKGFGVKKTDGVIIHLKADAPTFEVNDEKSPIIVCDWIGNFKKGTFELASTWVEKKKWSTGQSLFAGISGLLLAGTGTIIPSLFVNPSEYYYKRSVTFEGDDSDWGKLEYKKWPDLKTFNNSKK